MREIKFRAWDDKLKKYSEFGSGLVIDLNGEVLNVDWNNLTINTLDLVVLEQYIGLKDKNGVEIYEGDIILHEDCSHVDGSPFVVEWEDDGVGDTDGGLGESYYVGFGFAGIPERCRVIGNIHENPELLNPTDSCTLEDEK